MVTSSGASLTAGGTWTNSSSEALKENFTQLDKEEILNKISQLRLEQWNYKVEDDTVKHIGPIAEQFYDLFGLGGSSKTVSSIDPAGIALVGVQALFEKIDWVGEYITRTADGIVGRFKEITTDKLNINGEVCVDDVCVTKEQFKTLLQNNGGAQTTTSSPDSPVVENNTPTDTTPSEPASDPTPTETTTSTDTTSTDVTPTEPAPEPTPEPVVEEPAPAPEPAPEPSPEPAPAPEPTL
jgi:hypothetical protein